jgi:hypothetical protein
MSTLTINKGEAAQAPDENIDPNALGQSEHDKEMMALTDDKVDNKEGQSSIEEEAGKLTETEQRPEWLPEKFKSVEDMAKAYNELESKLGQKQEEPAAIKEESKESDMDMGKYEQEFSDTGVLGDASRAELNARGIPNEMIDGYLNGINAQQGVQVQEFKDSVGGNDVFEKVSQWAGDNADEKVLSAYNDALGRGDTVTAQALFGTMVSGYEKTNGTMGRRVTGQSAESSSDSFQSMAEVTEAMKDVRYMGPETKRDPAYIRSVEAKLARSNF